LHQFLIKWIDGEIEVVHADASAYIVLANATADWQHGSAQCLSGRDLTDYNFLSISKEGFVPVSVKPASEAPWKLFFDCSTCREGHGVEVVLVSPRGAVFEQTARLEYFCTNNQDEYEDILLGL
jgi:hypothetical protein